MMKLRSHNKIPLSVGVKLEPKSSNLDTLSDVNSLPEAKSKEKRKYVVIDSPDEHYNFSTTSQRKRRITMQEYQSKYASIIQPYSEDAARHVEIMRRQYQLDAEFDLLFQEMQQDILLGLEISHTTINKAIHILLDQYPKGTHELCSDDDAYSIDMILSMDPAHIAFIDQVELFIDLYSLQTKGYAYYPLVKLLFERHGLPEYKNQSFSKRILQYHESLVINYGYKPADVVALAERGPDYLDAVVTHHQVLCELDYDHTQILNMFMSCLNDINEATLFVNILTLIKKDSSIFANLDLSDDELTSDLNDFFEYHMLTKKGEHPTRSLSDLVKRIANLEILYSKRATVFSRPGAKISEFNWNIGHTIWASPQTLHDEKKLITTEDLPYLSNADLLLV